MVKLLQSLMAVQRIAEQFNCKSRFSSGPYNNRTFSFAEDKTGGII